MKRTASQWIIGLLSAVLWSGAALAQDEAVTDRLKSAMDGWLTDAKAANGAIAITYQGSVVAAEGFGMQAETPVEMASLSKAITAVCAHTLVRDGMMGWGDPVTDHLPTAPANITVGDLMRQATGLTTDGTQGTSAPFLGSKDDAGLTFFDRMKRRGAPKGSRGHYTYNNENYMLLGLVIQDVAAASVAETCAARVLAPAGVMGQPSPMTGAFLSWGGWQMTAADYARFHAHWFGPDGEIGRAPFALPHVDMGRGAYYGAGTTFREFRGSHNFWHFGLWCFPDRLNVGGYAVLWEGQWGAVAVFEGCHDWDTLYALDGALSRAVYPK